MGVPPNHPSHEWPFCYWSLWFSGSAILRNRRKDLKMLDTLVYPVWGLIYFRFLDILVRFVRIKLTDRIKKSGDLRQPKCSEKAHTQNLGVSMFVPFLFWMKAISEWERILLAWFLDALLFIKIVSKLCQIVCKTSFTRNMDQFQKFGTWDVKKLCP